MSKSEPQQKFKTKKTQEVKSVKDISEAEQMIESLDDIAQLAEKVKDSQFTLTKDNYIMQFGRYMGMYAKDGVKLGKINKRGKMVPVGRRITSHI